MITEKILKLEISRIWEWMEETYAIPFVSGFRQHIENKICRQLNDPGFTSNELKKLIDNECRALALWAKYHSSRGKDNQAASGNESEGATTKSKNHKSFEKRFKKFSFIADRTLTTDELRAQTLMPGRRVNWKKMCAAWNIAHPRYKHKLTRSTFKTEWCRAKHEKELRLEYFARKANYFYDILSSFVVEVEEHREFLLKRKEARQIVFENDTLNKMKARNFKGFEFDEVMQELVEQNNAQIQMLQKLNTIRSREFQNDR